MGFFLEKTETKKEITYKIKPKQWYIGGSIVFVSFVIGLIYQSQNPNIFLLTLLLLYLWFAIIIISTFPLWWVYLSNKKTITREKTGFGVHKTVWKIKK